MTLPRTTVEVIDPTNENNYLVKAREIHINGQAVCVERDSFYVEYDEDGPVKVHLTILPDSVAFRRKPAPEPILTRMKWEDIKNASVDWRDPAPRFIESATIPSMIAQHAIEGKTVVICGSHITTRHMFETVVSLLDGNISKVYRTNGKERIYTTSEGYVCLANSPHALRGMSADTVWLVDASVRSEESVKEWKDNISPAVATSKNRTIIFD